MYKKRKKKRYNAIMMHLLYALICIWCTTTYAHNTTYDVIVVGAGPIGIFAAQSAASYGKQVAIIEQDITARNRVSQGDIQIKAFIKASQIAHTMQEAHLFGLPATNLVTPVHSTLKYIQKVVRKSNKLYEQRIQELGAPSIIYGHATFIDAHTIDVQGTHYHADRFIIATGGHPDIPSIPGIDTVPYYTKETFFSLSELPTSIIIIGQGPLGVELATALHRLGVQVTFLVKHGLILPHYDFELVELEYKALKAAGIKLFCGATVTQATHDGEQVIITYQNQQKKEKVCKAQALLIALDMIGNTAGLGLETIGVQMHHDGIIVGDTMKTSVESVYACGDVVGRMYTLTRVAFYQAHIAAYNACRPVYIKEKHANYSNVSSVIEGVIPLGTIGLAEQEARKQYGNKLTIYHHAYADSARAIIDNSTDGFIKCICHEDGKLLGVHVAGEGADQIIDSVHIGERFDHQFAHYLSELRTSPNYVDILWQTALQSRKDHPESIIKVCVQYIVAKLQRFLGFLV